MNVGRSPGKDGEARLRSAGASRRALPPRCIAGRPRGARRLPLPAGVFPGRGSRRYASARTSRRAIRWKSAPADCLEAVPANAAGNSRSRYAFRTWRASATRPGGLSPEPSGAVHTRVPGHGRPCDRDRRLAPRVPRREMLKPEDPSARIGEAPARACRCPQNVLSVELRSFPPSMVRGSIVRR
jgi:hypothetical protein